MTRTSDLAADIEALRALLRDHGITEPEPIKAREDLPDYIPHGSERHAAFLGLVLVDEADETVRLADFTSPRTGKTYRLEDEMGAIRHYPGIDPEKAVALVLQQLVNELELKPEVPADAPSRFVPAAVYPS